MTVFSIAIGEARALWISLLPHAGKRSDDTPHFGRVRHYLAPGTLVAATTDATSAALAVVSVTDPGDGELDTFDLDVEEIKAALAVFTPPSSKDARSAWEELDLEVKVESSTITFREVGGLLDGQALTVPRPQRFGEDHYPDVPGFVAKALARASVPDPTAIVTPPSLGRFIPSAKAWGTGLTLRLAERSVVVTAGPQACFAGVFYADYPDEPDREAYAKETVSLLELLTPLTRGEKSDG